MALQKEKTPVSTDVVSFGSRSWTVLEPIVELGKNKNYVK